KATNRLTFSFDQAVPGNGWHRLEGLERNEPFRWTGPPTVSTLDFSLDLHDGLALEFRILNSTTPEVLQSLQVKANGHRLRLIPLYRDESGAMFRCTLSASLENPSNPFTRLSFHIQQTIPFNLIDETSDDKRPVGLAISLVQFFPLDSRPTVEMIKVPIDSEPWFEAIAFLKERIQSDQTLLGPNAFRLVFPDYMPYSEKENIGTTIDYSGKTLRHQAYDWVIIHKGVNNGYVGWILLQILLLRLKPIFANSVFVIFAKQSLTKQPASPPLGYFSRNVRSAFTRYLKHQLQKRLKKDDSSEHA
ncbi:MAG: hypothetical protein F6K16_42715, partial [Symploca sp. SIO2B6]|nr:hypothetical protein [Symploca sp. SIO2B6]